jgi:hypothetical protein
MRVRLLECDVNLRFVVAAAGVALSMGAAPCGAQWLNYPTPGIPRLPDGKPNLSAPAPRTADGKPDFAGLWAAECLGLSSCWSESRFFDLTRGVAPADTQMTPWAAAIQQQRESRDHVDDPVGYCLPQGYPRMAFPNPFKILVTPAVTAFLYETGMGMVFRQVFTDGRPLPEVTEPTWMGYSVGRWNGDTFVVETSGFKDLGWLDTRKARPHSDALRVVDRFRRVDFGHIEWTLTIDDPKAFLKPWTTKILLTLVADSELLEAFCDNHDKTMEHRRITPAPPEPPSPALPAR